MYLMYVCGNNGWTSPKNTLCKDFPKPLFDLYQITAQR